MPLPSPPHRAAFCIVAALVLLLFPFCASAQLGYTGGVVSQNFDTLPSYGEFTLAGKGPYDLTDVPFLASGTTGWSVYQNSGIPVKFSPGDGSVSTSSLYSLGGFGGSDRALGHISSSSRKLRAGWILRNDTGATITEFTFAFAGEQWRNGGSGNPNEMEFAYRVTPTLTNLDSNTGFMEVTAAKFTSPISGGAAGPLNGNDPANRAELSANVTGITWPAGEFLTLRWQDLDESGSDDALALDDVLFYAPPSGSAPLVSATIPENGANPVLPNSEIKVTFDQPVTTTGTWFTVVGNVSGPVAATASGGPLRFTIAPDSPLPSDETFTVTLIDSQITNTAATPMAADHAFSFTTLPPSFSITGIHSVQGSGGVSPSLGAEVTVEGVVVADFQGAFPNPGGFFLQEEDVDADGDAATSEGIFVFDRDLPSATDVSLGDNVRVTGIVTEYKGLTEISNPSSVLFLGSVALPSPTTVTMPASDFGALERYEGMRVSFPQTLTVTGSDDLGSRGQLELSSGGALEAPTESIDLNDDPASGTASTGSSNVAAVLAARNTNLLRLLVLDDASDEFYPDATPFLNGENTRRCGDSVSGLSGILSQLDGDYRVLPTGPVSFTDSNPRPGSPGTKRGRVRVASMNVLNYFTTLEDRGADNALELARQKGKIISALSGLNADVIGLIELENNGTTALEDLLNGLNAALGSPVYAAVADPVAGSGGDAIRNALIYKTAIVTPIGDAHLDTDAIWNGAHPLRPPLAQLFEETATNERFIVCVNHLKSKSSTGASDADLDQGDGQGSYNDLRKQLATRLMTFLGDVETATSESDILIIGDLNAYGEEDPIDILRAGGWTDQLAATEPGQYSYRRSGERGRLDHAFTSSSLAPETIKASHWAINADEPSFLDYNTENKTIAQQANNVGSAFRSSDHDPVVVELFSITYDYWTSQIISWNGADSSPTGDPNHNGLTNLEEYFHGLDPLQTSTPSLGPAIVRTGNDLEITWPQRRHTGSVTVIPQWSENLDTWSPMNAPTFVSTLDDIRDEMKATVSHGGKTELFGRLLLSRP